MTEQASSDQLFAYLRELGFKPNNNYLREALRDLMQLLIELEVSAAIEANPYERKQDRVAYRNGYRERNWQTTVGEIRLRIPKLRRGTYYPSIIESLGQAEQVLLALIQESFLLGIHLEDIEELLDSLGVKSLHRSDIWEFYEILHDITERFHNHPLDVTYPYLWLEVLNLKAKNDHHKGSKALVIAIGIKPTGEYEVVGFETANNANDEALWQRFLEKLAGRGLADVRLVISDSYYSVREAVRDVFPHADWQHSQAYSLHNILKSVPLDDQQNVVAAISTLFLVKPRDEAMVQVGHGIRSLALQRLYTGSNLNMVSQSLLPHLNFLSLEYEIASMLVLVRLKLLLEHQADAIGVSFDGAAIGSSTNPDLVALDSYGEMFELYGEMTPPVLVQNPRMAG